MIDDWRAELRLDGREIDVGVFLELASMRDLRRDRSVCGLLIDDSYAVVVEVN